MASQFLLVQNLVFGNCPKLPFPQHPLLVSHITTFSSPKCSNFMNIKYLPRSSSRGVPNELVEDSKFVPLNASDPQFGPPALLLLGFEVDETAKIQRFLKEMDGEFLEVIYCTEDMINRSIWEAVNMKQPNLDSARIAKEVPRICFFSGLTGEEMIMFIDTFPEAGLEPTIFAAMVPNSANKPIYELIEEIMRDHEMMSGKQ